MADKPKEAKPEAVKAEKAPAPELVYKYACPKCGKTAIKTSNKMLGVMINCAACKTLIKLDKKASYKKL